VPYLGNISLQEVTPAIWDNWMRSLQNAGYSKGSLSDIHSLLHHECNRTIMIDDFWKSELKHWRNQQVENEKSASDSYVQIYRDAVNKMFQQSKVLRELTLKKLIWFVLTKMDAP